MRAVFLAAAVALFSACASTRAPAAELGAARATADAAEKVGAPADARAAQHLSLARAQITRATELIRQGDEVRASFVLKRAQADAELALSLAQEAPLRRDAAALLGDLRDLEER